MGEFKHPSQGKRFKRMSKYVHKRSDGVDGYRADKRVRGLMVRSADETVGRLRVLAQLAMGADEERALVAMHEAWKMGVEEGSGFFVPSEDGIYIDKGRGA